MIAFARLDDMYGPPPSEEQLRDSLVQPWPPSLADPLANARELEEEHTSLEALATGS